MKEIATMDLGDRVYAAEKIMKKRNRRVRMLYVQCICFQLSVSIVIIM